MQIYKETLGMVLISKGNANSSAQAPISLSLIKDELGETISIGQLELGVQFVIKSEQLRKLLNFNK